MTKGSYLDEIPLLLIKISLKMNSEQREIFCYPGSSHKSRWHYSKQIILSSESSLQGGDRNVPPPDSIPKASNS